MASVSRRFVLLSVLFSLSAAFPKYQESQASDGLKVAIDKIGNFQININGQAWLASSPSFVNANNKTFSTDDGSLKLVSITDENGQDVLGKWTSQIFNYQLTSLPISVKLSFKQYEGMSAIFFGQHFSDGLNGTSVGHADAVCTGFPNFQVGGGSQVKLGFMAYGGIMVGDTHMSQGQWNSANGGKITSGLDSGPLVLFNGKGDTVVISSFSEFMAVSSQYTKAKDGQSVVNWGIFGKASSIPEDFGIWTVLHYSNAGVNKAMLEWGKTLRTYYNKGSDYMLSDFANNYIGYWTDNGAYYYYLTEQGKTYQQTIIDVKDYADKLGIPYRYIQYDSWWYYKGPGSGVTNWISRPDVFPDGMFYVYNKTGWPVVAHNRWWSPKTVYAKQNGGVYDFIIEKTSKRAMPVDQDFWDDLMQSSKKWGLITYEQDWLNTEFDTMDVTVRDVRIGRQWLRQMGKAAQKNGVTVQYCMSPSRHILESLEIPTVTQARVSGDYHPGKMQWKIGKSSIFAQAVGVAPFKDNYWTTTHQPGNKYNATEPYPELNSVVSTMSTGPVGPSDMVGGSNADLIMMSCNSDGLILKPSKPATAIDNNIYEAAFAGYKGELWSTYSKISGHVFGILFGADLTGNHQVRPSDAWPGVEFGDTVVFPRDNPSALSEYSEKSPVTLENCEMEDGKFCLFYTSPVLAFGSHKVVIFGEMSKWVPMSPQRVARVDLSSNNIHVHLKGGAGENVVFSYLMGNRMTQVKCVLSGAGSAKISIASSTCDSI